MALAVCDLCVAAARRRRADSGQPRQWICRCVAPGSWSRMPAALVIGMGLFALRTWHYTGEFSMLRFGHKPARRAVWQPGMSFRDAAAAALSSVMMVATTTDPHRTSTPARSRSSPGRRRASLALSRRAVRCAGCRWRLRSFTIAGFAIGAD